tara:strand:- start:10814 stop:10954 length:141 start_codon:yes stop_codon:yes gene_type:complete
MKYITNRINNYPERKALNHIGKVSKTLYPKPNLEDDEDNDCYPVIK